MERDMTAAKSKLDRKLKQLKTKSYLSGELIELLDTVSHLQLTAYAEATVCLPPESGLASTEDVLRGVSLIPREEFPFDQEQAKTLLDKLLNIVTSQEGPLGQGAATVKAALQQDEFAPDQLFRYFLDNDTAFFASWAERTPGAPKTLPFLVFAAMSPSIEAAADMLADKLPEMKVTPVGTCPICGSLPLISSLQQKEGFRHATCSFCRHDYRIKRIACPICGEEEQTKLTFFTAEEEPGFRVDVCDTCRTYIKTIDFRDLDRISVPVLDDLDSLALDYVAAGQGYKRATLSAWGF